MAAYAALVSVMHIIDNLQNHPHPPITIDKAQTQSLTEKIAFLQDFLESYNFHGGSEELESLQSRIADAAHAAEDVIESHIVDQIYDARPRSTGFERLPKLIKGMDFITREVMKIIQEKVDITEQTHNDPRPPIALDENQVESEKITILLDFVESYDSQCLLHRIANAAEDSIESDIADQIVTENVGTLQTLFRSYNSLGDECLQTRILDAAYAAEDVIESHIVDQICALSRSTNDGEETSGFESLQKLIEGMDFIKTEVTKIIQEMADITEQTHNLRYLHEKQVESEKIAILLDFVESYNTDEMQCLLHRTANAAEDSIESDTADQIVTENISMLQNLFRAYNSVGDECLQTRIADAVYAAEDNMKSHILDLIWGLFIDTHGDGKNTSSVDFYQRLQKVIEDMDLIEWEVKEIRNKVGLKDRLHITVSSKSPSKGQNIMVGFDDMLYQILDKLTRQRSDRLIIPIVGMGGIGKTTLARNVYESKLVAQHFDVSSWVTISQEYNVNDVISEILSKQDKQTRATSTGTREEDLGLQLHKHLWGRRYLVILDDMWSTDVWDELKKFFPENNCGSRIIVTTRLSNLALELSGKRGIEMSFLDEESSWTLLSKTVFGEEGCPHDGLEDIGKKIAGNCKGLPLSIVVIGGLLAKHSSEPAYWEYVAGNLNSFVNLEDDERCYKTLRTSYDLLPTRLKPCFLYMGIYPEDHEISVSELIKLWVAEGFLNPINGKSLEVAAREYLMDLIDRNLVLVHKLGTSSGKVKSCIIHDLLRDLCLKQARKEKFLCVTTRNGLFSEGISTQRRFAVHGKTSTEVQNSKKVAFQFASLARSFISHFVEVLPSLNSRFLRVLKAVDACLFTSSSVARSYNLGVVFDDYVNSRHLAIDLPRQYFENISFSSSVYYPWNLQTLIVGGSDTCSAPPEIWKMPLLRHVKLPKFYVLDPPTPGSDIDGEGDDFVLWNLQTLSTVCNFKFGEGVIKRIPNIQKLKLCYEDFEEGFEVASHYFLNNLGSLHKLESLGCFFWCNRPSGTDLLQNLTFPHSLKELSLKGTWLSWEDMSKTIGPLPVLEVLKLYGLSFTGPRWETIEGQFCNLRFMLIAFSDDLIHWITESTHFPRLEQLVLQCVPHLAEIPLCIGEISTLQSMKVEYCSDGAVISAKAIQEAHEEYGNESFKVQVISWKKQCEVIKALATPNFQVEYPNV